MNGAKRFSMITGLLDSRADYPVMSEDLALFLGLTVRSTLVRTYDMGNVNYRLLEKLTYTSLVLARNTSSREIL